MSRLEDWMSALVEEFGLPRDSVDTQLVLDLARDVAHGVARPAAPLSTFVLGLAAGLRGGNADDVRSAAERIVRMAGELPAEPATDGGAR